MDLFYVWTRKHKPDDTAYELRIHVWAITDILNMLQIQNLFIYYHSRVWGQQGCINLIKSDRKEVNNVTKYFYFKYILFFLTFYSSKNNENNVTISRKILSSTAVFNIDNNKKCFLSSKSAYLNDFWRIMWHWRLDAENTAFQHWNKLYFYIKKNILYYNNNIIVTVFTVITVFWQNGALVRIRDLL